MERLARLPNGKPEDEPQNIANVLTALGNDAAAAAVSPRDGRISRLLRERHAVAMNAQEVSTTLNAYAEMRKRQPQASAAVTETAGIRLQRRRRELHRR